MITTVVCYSHLRWNFVYQRPQHLLSRFATRYRVIFFEEPMYGDHEDQYTLEKDEHNEVWIVTPRLFHEKTELPQADRIKKILNSVFEALEVEQHIALYYTPMALAFSRHLKADLVVYDCMDELSAFKHAPTSLMELEEELFQLADVIFTGGHTLYHHKKQHHTNIYPFPSSIDTDHFLSSREIETDPMDQAGIPFPRLGYYGVIDERIDLELIRELAAQRPGWNLVFIGPIAKIDPEKLPRATNIFYLGQKTYDELPHYLSGWNIAIMPFALNESTRFISPTKTPEYLAGGKAVISTAIQDVIEPYGNNGLVHIAATAEEFIEAGESILADPQNLQWRDKVDSYLSTISWDKTWNNMMQIIDETISKKLNKPEKNEAYV